MLPGQAKISRRVAGPTSCDCLSAFESYRCHKTWRWTCWRTTGGDENHQKRQGQSEWNLFLMGQEMAVDLLACHEQLVEASLRAVALVCLADTYPPALGARAIGAVSSQVPFRPLLNRSVVGGCVARRTQESTSVFSWPESAAGMSKAERSAPGQAAAGPAPPPTASHSLLQASSGRPDAQRHRNLLTLAGGTGGGGRGASCCLPQPAAGAAAGPHVRRSRRGLLAAPHCDCGRGMRCPAGLSRCRRVSI